MTGEPSRPTDAASWNQRYIDENLPWDTGEADPHLGEVIGAHGIQPGKALEIGCGTGTNTIWLARQGFEMTGLDLAPTAIARAKEKVAAAEVDCQLFAADILTDEVPGAPYPFVYDRGVFHVFDSAEDRSRFAARIAKLLAPAGLWHSLVGSTDGPPRDSGPPRRSAFEITQAVEPHFEILELNSTVFHPDRANPARAWILVARRRER